MEEAVGFVGTDYNNAVSLFTGEYTLSDRLIEADVDATAGYCIGGFPNSIIVSSNKIRLSYWFPFCAFSWGLLTLGLAFVTSVWQVQVIRFFSAIFEVSTFAGAHYALGAWYKPTELAKRASLVVAIGNCGNL
jgi:ACS family pantothenate transporter-like MFS transporter